ncbi:hypothetical protein [Muricauda sp. MAR_2010_75]|uniref:hypothetical protein n=1 Tax=Allomuricauda sp. MAR_2010_75 TaxID=1250232 RepID=UPI0012DFF7B6|nr:hypothetical protein [Muricauda sp. MAR_2010_75]
MKNDYVIKLKKSLTDLFRSRRVRRKGVEVLKQLDQSLYDQVLLELDQRISEKENQRNDKELEFWEELNKYGELNKLHGKIKEGGLPNDLECLLMEIIRV